MRVLYSCLPYAGHFHPLAPIARAMAAAGHEVAFATGPSLVPQIAAAGFAVHRAGGDPITAAQVVAQFPEFAQMTALERGRFAFERFFTDRTARPRLPDLLALCDRWRPDLVVRDHCEFAGCIAAETLGLPHAAIAVGNFRQIGEWRRDRIAASLDGLRAIAGLTPDPALAMPFRYLLLFPEPPSLHDPAMPLPPVAHFIRPDVFDRSGDEGLPPWVAALPSRPTVYATLGTVVNHRADIFEAIIAGLREEPVNLIVTVGRNGDPARFGPQPDNVHIERYIPQSLLLPHCAAVVMHGGMNSLRSALACGLPVVVIPFAADQFDNAERIAALALGRVLTAAEATPRAIQEAMRAILADPIYRRNAERVRAEIAAMPGPEHAVALLERLAAEKQPLLAAQ